MTKTTARTAALQVGEFAIGAAAAYLAVGAVWIVSGAVWAPIVVAVALAAAAVLAELRFGARATGLVVGVLPVAVVMAGLLATVSLVVANYR